MLLERYVEDIREAMAREESAILGGACASFEDYRHRAGILKGLRKALDLLEEVVKTTPKEDRF